MQHIKINPKNRDNAYLLLVAYVHRYSDPQIPSEAIDGDSFLPEVAFKKFFSREYIRKLSRKDKSLKEIDWHPEMRLVDLLDRFFPLPKLVKKRKKSKKKR